MGGHLKTRRSLESQAKFRNRVLELGGTPAWDEWKGVHAPHRIYCAAGHETWPRPGNVITGQGLCGTCAGNDTAAAETAYRERLAELGVIPRWDVWQGVRARHPITCREGHETSPVPTRVLAGRNACSTCSGRAPGMAEAHFRARLAKLGATPAWDHWAGTKARHRVHCAREHECWPAPSDVKQGQGICLVCARRDTLAAQADCKARLAELGAFPLWDEWLGAKERHMVLCAGGHICWPMPTEINQGRGPCSICAGNDAAATEAAVRERLIELGATPLWTEWKGANARHLVRCRNDHERWITPASIRKGNGPCRVCSRDWDVFYVVVNEERQQVKLGITMGDTRPRLKAHRTDGFRRVEFLATGIPEALLVEDHLLDVLAGAGYKSVRGREYFPVAALGLILDTVRECNLMNEAA